MGRRRCSIRPWTRADPVHSSPRDRTRRAMPRGSWRRAWRPLEPRASGASSCARACPACRSTRASASLETDRFPVTFPDGVSIDAVRHGAPDLTCVPYAAAFPAGLTAPTGYPSRRAPRPHRPRPAHREGLPRRRRHRDDDGWNAQDSLAELANLATPPAPRSSAPSGRTAATSTRTGTSARARPRSCRRQARDRVRPARRRRRALARPAEGARGACSTSRSSTAAG